VIGTVHETLGGSYRVRLDSGDVVQASLRGRLKRQTRTGDRVVIGDRVELLADGDGAFTVESVLARDSELVRRGPGGRGPKVVVANLDRLVVVMALARPKPTLSLLDRLLVLGESSRVEPVIVFNKADLLEASEPPGGAVGLPSGASRLAARYRGIGYSVLETSAETGVGLSELNDLISRGFSALVGPSGVGKSSLLNALEPGLGLRVGDLSQRRGRGRHTTVSARMVALASGGFVADTPGFSDAGTWGVNARQLEECFPDFSPFRDHCRFRACTHLHEPGCGVQRALSDGQIVPDRFESYRALVQESEGS